MIYTKHEDIYKNVKVGDTISIDPENYWNLKKIGKVTAVETCAKFIRDPDDKVCQKCRIKNKCR